ncbi:AI-2E family transporter [Pseudonocardia asaccharolytica]|uniref:AI-2E family transporter n=1 Tax=Pseudonocardia asaccharolytica DSM 44247 = NBRC 16224 TaxID=1123024 RepID=A0A511D4E5_9PSEU|nr:AI-2E family transporter [Pseudonocardia asaccharolytica]GEL19662.1 AI-2E family transporter [Pseudonocardia asaccharolytica DSM 44247 = NBRC 16224]
MSDDKGGPTSGSDPDPHAAPRPITPEPRRSAPEPPAGANSSLPERDAAALVPTPLRVVSEVCARILIIAAALALLLFLIVQLRVVVIPVAIAVLLTAFLAPTVHWLVSRRVPRGISTALVLVGGLVLFGGLLSFVINALISGFGDLREQLSASFASIQRLLSGPPFNIPASQLQNLPDQLGRAISNNRDAFTSGALSTAATVTEIVAGIALALFSLIFLLYDGPRIWRFLLRGVPQARRERVDVAGRRAFASLVGYTRATVLVAIVDATGIGIGLGIVGVPLVVPLAALVFLGAFVPTVGAVITGAVAVLIALVANGLIPALIVLGVVIGVQQLEGHVLQPLLLGRAVRLHPLAVVLAVAAGVVIAGIPGGLLAVPVLAVLTAGTRSMTAQTEPEPHLINPIDPRQSRAVREPIGPRKPSRLARLLRRLVGREQADPR